MNTFTVLKPEQGYDTIFITRQDHKIEDIFVNSSVELMLTELPIPTKETKEIIELYEDQWLDLNDNEFKVPTSKQYDVFVYEQLDSDDFLALLIRYPRVVGKLIAREFYKDIEEVTTRLDNELYEFYQTHKAT
ncbi:TPA: hypothetical protein NJ265_000165 [Vibrio parahaemolyticus]|uniref:hypothetical protein n=1 Tax=Vibrio harveyi group TaxID=717610 RepID=UPI00111D2C7F|nr:MULTISPECIES: hypothetical protein [Vibrio harveyi group]TOH02340.1 hypothetical protein CGI88_19855 [Vibrio parahaemolyticus]HCE1825640.1 hypothetical protein [Vibrio parahaemolyticus]HCE5180647.1 hypothetical protein [Vibrio parahaemolyticus]HCG5604382.1 hypothetical protein [Vibrio parahaemolyticus]HCG6432096.1 hypothetical protein [Vibrio parahaemolyticus]